MKLYKLGILAVASLAMLAGCSKGSSSSTPTGSLPVVFFSMANTTDPWHKLYQIQLDEAVKRHATDFQFEIADAGGSDKKQSQQIEDEIAKKPKVIMVSPVTPKVVPAINKAHDAGILVFVLDMEVDSKADFFLGSSNIFTGRTLVMQYCRNLGARRSGPILVIPGKKEDTTQWQWLDGVKKEMDHSKVNGTVGPDCDDSEDKAKAYVAQYLKTNKTPPDAILAITDNMAMGAGEAVKEANAPIKYIFGIGADTKACYDALRSGLFYGSVYRPASGPQALDMIPDLLIGKMPPKNSVVGNDFIRQDTLDRFFETHPEAKQLN